MRTTARLVTLLALTAPGVALVGPLAAAAPGSLVSVKPGVLQAAWFWQTAYEQANSPVAETPPVTEPSGVPAGDLAVATTTNDGSSTKMTALSFSLGKAAKAGSTITAFTFTMTRDSSPTAMNLTASETPVVACLITRGWSPAEGGDYTNAPAADCDSTLVKPTVKGDTFTFEIPSIAQQWVGAPNLGVALLNDPKNTQPFQVVFTGPKTITAKMQFTPPVPAVTGVTGKRGGGGAGSPSTPTTGSSTGSSGSASAPVPTVVPGNPPATTTDSGAAAPAPQVATPTTAPAAASGQLRHAPATPSAPFWIAAVALALLVGTAYVVLRDPVVPVPTATTTRLSRVLRERELERQRDALPTLSPRRA